MASYFSFNFFNTPFIFVLSLVFFVMGVPTCFVTLFSIILHILCETQKRISDADSFLITIFWDTDLC